MAATWLTPLWKKVTPDYLISQRIWFFAASSIIHTGVVYYSEQAIYYRFLFATQHTRVCCCSGMWFLCGSYPHITPASAGAAVAAAALHSQWINLMIEWHKATFCGLSAPPPASTNNLLEPSLFRCEFNAPVWERFTILIKVTRAIIAGLFYLIRRNVLHMWNWKVVIISYHHQQWNILTHIDEIEDKEEAKVVIVLIFAPKGLLLFFLVLLSRKNRTRMALWFEWKRFTRFCEKCIVVTGFLLQMVFGFNGCAKMFIVLRLFDYNS